MPLTIDVPIERTLSGTPKRIFQLLSDMGTSADAIWPFSSQPFMRSPGPLEAGRTEEWHQGLHALLERAEPDDCIVWRLDNEGVEGTHGFYLTPAGKRTKVTHRLEATLSDPEGRLLWRRIEDQHRRTIDALFDKMARVLKR